MSDSYEALFATFDWIRDYFFSFNSWPEISSVGMMKVSVFVHLYVWPVGMSAPLPRSRDRRWMITFARGWNRGSCDSAAFGEGGKRRGGRAALGGYVWVTPTWIFFTPP